MLLPVSFNDFLVLVVLGIRILSSFNSIYQVFNKIINGGTGLKDLSCIRCINSFPARGTYDKFGPLSYFL